MTPEKLINNGILDVLTIQKVVFLDEWVFVPELHKC